MMDVAGLRTVRRRGLADEAADRIRDAIFAGVFPPGAPLREVELAASLGVSRGSVREGLARLTGEGLVESEWHKGNRVRSLSAEDVRELYTLRTALDELAMRTAVSRGADLGELDDVVAEMARAVDRDADATELLALDMRFHDAVYAASGHRRLTEAWEGIRSQIYLFLLIRIRVGHDYRGLVVPEHTELVAVLRSGDPDRAAALADGHVRGAYERLVDHDG